MIQKFKKIIQKDYFLTSMVIYFSGWLMLILYFILDYMIDNSVIRPRIPANHSGNTGYLLESILSDITMILVFVFPLVALFALVNIKISLNRIENKLAE